VAALRILITGASSFTGSWFARALAEAGHDVTATFRRRYYEGLRAERVRLVTAVARPLWGVAFGDIDGEYDVLCAHGAEVGNYRSTEFDADAAVAENTRDLERVVAGMGRVVVTGTVFEALDTPYGISKRKTWEAFEPFGAAKFVIPNPFGPWENEPRFTTYLARTWLAGETAIVKTPQYQRDNIHVQALTDAYVRFVESDRLRAAPSQYRETQLAFAHRCSRELAEHLRVDCAVEAAEQTDFSQPLELVNTDTVDGPEPWGDLAGWYLR
jgi:nucleoside-diphosphate-sugar epimerase